MKKYFEIAIHLVVWATIIAIYFILGDNIFTQLFYIFNGVVFYLQLFVFFPFLLRRRKYVTYCLLSGISILGIATVHTLVVDWSGFYNSRDFLFSFHLFVFAGLQCLIFIPLAFLYQFAKDYILYKKFNKHIELGVFLCCISLLGWNIFEKAGYLNQPENYILSLAFLFFFMLTHLFLFFINSFYFIPQLLAKKKEIKYVLLLLITILVVVTANYFSSQIHQSIFKVETVKTYFEWSVNIDLFLITSLSFLYRFSKDWVKNEKIKQQLVFEKSKTELAFLRSQVNPHFLFNSLNTLYGSALLEKAENTAEAISNLGGMMRYMLHQSDKEFVSLEKELEYVANFIDLQKKRIVNQENIEINHIVEGEPGELQITPVVLIPLIENAFKHGVSLKELTLIDIKIKVAGNLLGLNIKNTNHSAGIKDEASGLGIENVRKRLSLVYPQKHKLEITETKEFFIVELQIDLKS